ncbi:MAG: hypothetical protein FJX03_02595 [Alphaproteobacteria bacterium]|nr:hypothetical protein [Alphaproteobacteria bacterium]
MKKLPVIFLIIILALSKFTMATEKFETSASLAVTKQNYQRNWNFPCKELASGLAFLAVSYASPFEELADIAMVASVGFLFDGALRFSRNFIEYYAEKLGQKEIDKRKKGLPGYYRTHSERRNELETLLIYPKIRSTRAAFRLTENLVNLAANLSLTYLVFIGDSSQVFTISGVGYPILFTLLMAGTVYNADEIRYTLQTGLTRGDRPVAKISNALTQAMLAHFYFVHHSQREIVKIPGLSYAVSMPRRLTSGEWAFYRFLQAHGDSEAVVGLTQLVLNSKDFLNHFFYRQPIVEEIKPIHFTQKQEPIQKAKSVPHHAVRPPVQERKEPLFESYSQDIRAELPPPKEPKKKTRGEKNNSQTSSASESSAPHQGISVSPVLQEDNENNKRDQVILDALARIEQLSRHNHTLAVRVANQEISTMLRFLPNASRRESGHNKSAIHITFSNGTEFKLRFEAPHQQSGASSSEYKGARKERVLDVLRICYLAGWDERKIREYMQAQQIVSFYNVPGHLIHVLWERGDL